MGSVSYTWIVLILLFPLTSCEQSWMNVHRIWKECCDALGPHLGDLQASHRGCAVPKLRNRKTLIQLMEGTCCTQTKTFGKDHCLGWFTCWMRREKKKNTLKNYFSSKIEASQTLKFLKSAAAEGYFLSIFSCFNASPTSFPPSRVHTQALNKNQILLENSSLSSIALPPLHELPELIQEGKL